MLQTPELWYKEVFGEKADSLKNVFLNLNITMEPPKFTGLSKRQVNKDLYSMQELYQNICTLL